MAAHLLRSLKDRKFGMKKPDEGSKLKYNVEELFELVTQNEVQKIHEFCSTWVEKKLLEVENSGAWDELNRADIWDEKDAWSVQFDLDEGFSRITQLTREEKRLLLFRHLLFSKRRVRRTSLLMYCCQTGREEIILQFFTPKLLTTKFVNAVDINQLHALYYACKFNHTRIACFLLENGFNVSTGISKKNFATGNFWYHVVRHNNVEVAAKVLEAANTAEQKRSSRSRVSGFSKFDINQNCFQDNSSSIIHCAKHGFVEMLDICMKFPGINIYQKNDLGRNAIEFAYIHSRENIVKLFELNPAIHRRYQIIHRSRQKNTFGMRNFDDNWMLSLDRLEAAASVCDMQTLRLAFASLDSLNSIDHISRVEQIYLHSIEAAVSWNDSSMLDFLLTQDASLLKEVNVSALLYKCCKRNNVDTFTSLVRGFGVTSEQTVDCAVLAAQNGFTDIVGVCMGLDVQHKQFHKVLTEAAKSAQYSVVSKVLSSVPKEKWEKKTVHDCFIICVKSGYTRTLEEIVMNGYNTNVYFSIETDSRTGKDVSLWEYAAASNRIPLLQTLLKCYSMIDINCEVSKSLGTPFLVVLKKRNFSGVKLFLDPTQPWCQHVNVNARDDQLKTPLGILLEATRSNLSGEPLTMMVELFELLLQHPTIDVNMSIGYMGDRPINLCRNDTLAGSLMQHPNFDFFAMNNYGFTSLTNMCVHGRYNQVKFLLDYLQTEEAAHVDLDELVNAKDLVEGETALIKCASIDRRYDVQTKKQVQGFVRCADLLIKYPGTNSCLKDNQGKTVFIHAAAVQKHGRNCLPPEGDVLELLLKHHAEGMEVGLRVCDGAGSNGFLYACQGGNLRVVKLLVESLPESELRHVNNIGASGFDLAVTSGSHELVVLLLEHTSRGIDVNNVNTDGRTPLLRACLQGDSYIVDMLLKHPSFSTVNAALEADGKAAIHLALESQNWEVFETLMQSTELDINQKEQRSGKAPLMMAVDTPESYFSSILSHRNVDINLQNHLGETALMLCITAFNLRYALMLLNKPGVDVNVADNQGRNVMHHAVEKGKHEAVSLLNNMCPGTLNLRHKSNAGLTPAELADNIFTSSGGNRRRSSWTNLPNIRQQLFNEGRLSGSRIPRRLQPDNV